MSSFQITPDTRMADLEAAVPGARRALFARYHIGGCSSCGFSPDETLASVCERNENLPVQEVIDHLQESAQRDRDLQISVQEVNSSLKAGEKLRLIDVRSREEHEAVALPDSELLSQDLISTLFAGPKDERIVVYCHHGVRSLDAAAYLIGHGLSNVKSMAGGIDAWSCEVDESVPRYRLEL